MKTTRRTFLKGSAAFATAVAAPTFIRSGRVSAQTPQYELIDLVTFSEGVEFGRQTLKGSVSAINASGQVAGTQVHEGQWRAAIWTLDGNVSILDSGEFGAFATVINSRGDVGGRLQTGEGLFNVWPAAWLNGELREAPLPDGFVSQDESGSVIGLVSEMNDDGVMTGSLGRNAFRWLEDAFEVLPLDPGAGLSGPSVGTAVSPAGSIGGSLSETAEAFIWKPDGSVQTFGLPWFPNGRLPEEPSISVLHLADDDELLILASEFDPVREVTDRMVVRYRSGIPEILPVFEGSEGFLIFDANDTGSMVGSRIVDGTDVGVLWIEGQLYDLHDLVAPSGLTIERGTAINDAGEIVSMSKDETGTTHGVVLRPM